MPRDTDYARELATAKLPSGEGKASVAIERLLVKGPKQVEIRFSWWEGSRMMPRPLDLPEHELLPLFREAIRKGVFSRDFLQDLNGLLRETTLDSDAPGQLAQLEAHFHDLIRLRASEGKLEVPHDLPRLDVFAASKEAPMWFPVPGMYGGFAYWLERTGGEIRLITESWCRVVGGSGQRHVITAAGRELVEEGFV